MGTVHCQSFVDLLSGGAQYLVTSPLTVSSKVFSVGPGLDFSQQRMGVGGPDSGR